jgi:hypothetical protein
MSGEAVAVKQLHHSEWWHGIVNSLYTSTTAQGVLTTSRRLHQRNSSHCNLTNRESRWLPYCRNAPHTTAPQVHYHVQKKTATGPRTKQAESNQNNYNRYSTFFKIHINIVTCRPTAK